MNSSFFTVIMISYNQLSSKQALEKIIFFTPPTTFPFLKIGKRYISSKSYFILVYIMRLTKILIFLIILMISAGIVSAADFSNLKAPSNFKFDGNQSFYETNILGMEDVEGVSLDIVTNDDLEEAKEALNSDEDANILDSFKNDSDVKYTVESTDDENIFSFTDGVNELKGYVELIQIGDEKYVLESYVDNGDSDEKVNKSLSSLKEFNELNNLKPLDHNSDN